MFFINRRFWRPGVANVVYLCFLTAMSAIWRAVTPLAENALKIGSYALFDRHTWPQFELASKTVLLIYLEPHHIMAHPIVADVGLYLIRIRHLQYQDT
jgi:hypothetical protein